MISSPADGGQGGVLVNQFGNFCGDGQFGLFEDDVIEAEPPELLPDAELREAFDVRVGEGAEAEAQAFDRIVDVEFDPLAALFALFDGIEELPVAIGFERDEQGFPEAFRAGEEEVVLVFTYFQVAFDLPVLVDILFCVVVRTEVLGAEIPGFHRWFFPILLV